MISIYFNTIRYLKFKQIYHRIFFNLIKPKIKKNDYPKTRVAINKLSRPIEKKISLLGKFKFYFLNKSMSLSNIGWDRSNKNVSKLWRYNQHYFDDLNAIKSQKRKRWHYELLEYWVKQNEIGKNIGWDSYPTSLRIVNWIKWHLLGNKLSTICLQSLVLQIRWLIKRIEWHILGNHLFSNAKALVFAGLFFSNDESKTWLKKGLQIIRDELDEQVLNDGGNFERSPMYHAIFLEDLLDLINISKVYPKVIERSEVKKWIKITISMFKWLDAMTHPDGEISFFNDSAIGVAPNFNKLKKYARKLGINLEKIKKEIVHLSDSGYIRYNSKNMIALLDVAPIGPDYLPAHAHADTLSFEVSLFGKRFLVNSGTSKYGTSKTRKYERSTKAHNTVVVNNQNSSEVWSGFRVAKRAFPFDLETKFLKNSINISCAHNGYEHLPGKPVHYRNWQFFQNSLIVKDTIKGYFEKAYAYFHFHPSVNTIKIKNNILNIYLADGKKVILKVKLGKAIIEKSYVAIEFGKRLRSNCLKVELDKNKGSCIKLTWKN